MKNKNAALNTAIQAITLLAVIIFSIWASMGFEINFDSINKAFVLKVGINLAVSLMCYNTIFGMFFGNLARNERCRYFITVATKKIRIEKIYTDNRFADLDTAVKKKNEDDLLELRNYKIRNICSRLSYEDISDFNKYNLNDKIKTISAKYTLSRFRTWRLKRVIIKILSGKIKSEELTADDILIERESEKINRNRLKLNEKKRAAKRNIVKTIKFLITTTVFAVITFAPANSNIWQVLVSNLSLFLGGAYSGVMAAANESRYITDLYDEHNKFIMRNLNISDEYIPPETNKI